MREPAERGFIIHPIERMQAGRAEVDLFGRMETGETFVVRETRLSPFFHVRQSELEAARAVWAGLEGSASASDSPRRTMDGEPTLRILTAAPAEAKNLRDELHRSGVRTYEADVKLSAQYVMDLRIRGTMEIRGPWRQGRRVQRVYENPELSPASFTPKVSVLSLDIETDRKATLVVAVALAPTNTDGGRAPAEVLIVGGGIPGARCFPTERDMLVELRRRIIELDPDVILGWNVIDFDFRVLARRFRELGLPFDIGRSDSAGRFLDRESTDGGAVVRWRRSKAIVEGRQVLDALWLVRLSGLTFDDYRLETVAGDLLGRGKLIERRPGESGAEAVERLSRTDPAALAAYCLEDARLVLDIVGTQGLMDLTVTKSLLIGTPLDQAWMSVASFELLYMEHLHARGFVAPTLGVDQDSLERTPGGGIITPRAGLYENVLVFDFKSLYPSIMRTFNIDPLTRLARAARPPGDDTAESFITAPHGERFSRTPGIIPEILDRFFESRERARAEGNRAATHAYKIVMNSFYGVLGTDGCRFAASGLAGAVTTFGQHILFWTRDKVKERGYEVLYGDTDSLFVLSGLPRGTGAGALEGTAATLAADLNRELAAYVRSRWDVEPRLELEFEAVYRRFFLPPMRTGAAERDGEGPGPESENRGRAKGYAGMRLLPGTADEQLEVVGMEAVRHDWTRLARELQTDLLGWVFADVSPAEIEERIRTRLARLRAGELDDSLVYRKVLRKPVEAYTKASPPHARAAAQLPPEERSGTIRYMWTRDGPQPETARSSPLDYEHYAEKQMRPIVEAVAPYAGLDAERIFAAGGQLGLF